MNNETETRNSLKIRFLLRLYIKLPSNIRIAKISNIALGISGKIGLYQNILKSFS